MCERRSVRICCDESPHDEAVDPALRAFHTVSSTHSGEYFFFEWHNRSNPGKEQCRDG